MTRYYAMFKQYAEDDPRPYSEAHGAEQTPPVIIWRIDGDIHIEEGIIHAGASWESPSHPDNVKALALAERICALLNADAMPVYSVWEES